MASPAGADAPAAPTAVSSAAAWEPSVGDPYGLPGAPAPVPSSTEGSPAAPPATAATETGTQTASSTRPAPSAQAGSYWQTALSTQTAFPWSGHAWPPPRPFGAPVAGGGPEPRRDPGRIAGGIVLTTLGGAGIFAGLALLLTSVAAGVTGGDRWQGLLGGGVVSLALGGVGIGVGIPVLRSGARKIVRDAPAAQLRLGPSAVTLVF